MEQEEGSRGASSRRSAAGMRAASRVEALFPLLKLLESPLSVAQFRSVIWLGIAIDFVQQFAFAVNPHFDYDFTVPKEISYFLYSFHVPIWDSTISSVTYSGFLVWYWIVAGIVLLVSGFLLASLFNYTEQKKNVLTTMLRMLIHLVESPLAVPMLHAFCANMFCHRKHLWAFPDEECWTLGATLYFCMSLLLLFCHSTVITMARSCLFDDTPFSRHPLARAHGRLDLMVTGQRILQVLFFHMLLGPGWRSAYCFFIVVLNFAVFCAYAVVCPYYHQSTTQLRCAMHLATMVAACISFAGTYLEDTFGRHSVNSQWLFAVAPLAAVLGYYLGGLRLLRECKERLWHLRQYGVVFHHKCYFPCGLPTNDLTMAHGQVSLSTLEREMLERGAKDAEESPGNPARQGELDVLVPSVRFITMTTDVELSTRFLRDHCLITGVRGDARSEGATPPMTMVGFGARIFVKAVVMWKDSTVVRAHFAHFILAYCPASKFMFALEQCDEALRGGELGVRFQAYKLHNRLRGNLGMHDRTHRYALERARKYHKEALTDMVQFWAKLMDGKSDIMNLAAIANQITDKRDRGHLEYQRAIRDSSSQDRVLLQSYAGFLENVMFESKQAELVRQRANELGEQMRQSLIGNKGNIETSSNVSESRRLLLEAGSDGGPADDSSASTSNAARLLSVAITITSTLLVLLTISSFLIELFNTYEQVATIDKVHTGGMTRTLVQMAGHEVYFVGSTIADNTLPTTTREEELFRQQERLRIDIARLEESNNLLTYGKYKTDYAPLIDYFREPRIALVDFHDGSDRPVEEVVVVGLWSMAQYILAALYDISVVDANNTAMADAFRTLRPIRFILENVPTKGAWAFNESVHLLELEDGTHTDWTLVGLAVTFVVTVLTIVAVNALIVFNFEKIGVTKIVALHLFSLIPYTVQEQLWMGAKDRVTDLDRETREEEQGEQLDAGILDGHEGEGDEEQEREVSSHSGHLGESLRKASTFDRARAMSIYEAGTSKRLVSCLKSNRGGAGRKRKKKKRVRFNLEGMAPQKSTVRITEKLSEPPPDAAEDGQMVGLLTREERRELLSGEGDEYAQQASAEKAAQRKAEVAEMKAVEQNTTAGLLKSIGFSTVLTCAAVALLVQVTILEKDMQSANQDRRNFLTEIRRFEDLQQEVRAAAQGVAEMGYLTPYWSGYWDTFHSRELMELRRWLGLLLNKDEVRLFEEAESQLRLIARVEKIALALAASGFGLRTGVTGDIRRLNWSEPADDYERYSGEFLRYSTYNYTTADKDLAKSPEERKALARQVLTSDRLQADLRQLGSIVSELRRRVLARLTDDEKALFDAYLMQVVIDIVLFALVVLALLLPWPSFEPGTYRVRSIGGGLVWSMWRRQHLRLPQLLLSLGLLVICSILSMGLLSRARVVIGDFQDVSDRLVDLQLKRNATLSAMRQASGAARLYVSGGDQLYYLQYWAVHDSGNLRELWQETEALLGPTLGVNTKAAAQAAIDELSRRHLIAFNLMWWAIDSGEWRSFPVKLQQRPEQLGVYWDRTQEANYDSDQETYEADTPHYQYNNTAFDRARPPHEQVEVARHTVFSRKYHDLWESAAALTAEYYSGAEQSLKAETDDKASELDGMTMAALVVGIIAVGFQVVLTVLIATYSLEVDIAGSKVEDTSQVLFARLTWRCRLAYLVILALLAAQFAFGVANAKRCSAAAAQLNAATKREWTVARSALYANQLYEAYTKDAVAEGDKRRVEEMIDDLKWVRNDLYFGALGTGSLRGVGGDSEQDGITFGTKGEDGFTDGVDRLYTAWIKELQELLLAVDRVSEAATNDTGNTLGAVTAAQVSAKDVHNKLRDAFDPLIEKLWASGVMYRDQGQVLINQNHLTYLIISCAMVVVIIAAYYVVFRPVIGQLTDEENGTKALLKMIPRQVRELVPKIAAYLEHGVMVDEAREAVVYPKCDVVQSFIGEFSRPEQDMQAAFAMLEQSFAAVVVSDDHGLCIHTNSRFPDVFHGYGKRELVGSNVSLLLPEALAIHHNRFMEAYKTSGIARVIGRGRDVLAVDKFGNFIHVIILLYECRRGDEVFFIAQFSPYTMLDEALRERMAKAG
eukprot:TRINITY_DN1854_c1_g1_i2.p1 TRINITY_DN1854_c1_g1~~TRINITY_DN1854_c1_g1_i2.p1  ORF type:complete len:2137 (+),score=808.03 TRINITY_DN1854_c1_g1_i2:117-6413(+)